MEWPSRSGEEQSLANTLMSACETLCRKAGHTKLGLWHPELRANEGVLLEATKFVVTHSAATETKPTVSLLPTPRPLPPTQPNIYCSSFAANTIAFQQRSKWPPPPPRFDTGQDNLTLRGYRGQGKARSAAGAGDGGGAGRGPGAACEEGAGHADTAARPARCCDGSGTGCCFGRATPQAWPWSLKPSRNAHTCP